MNKQHFSFVENPRIRIPTIDAGRLSHNKTSMIGFLEVDVTDLRRKIKELRRQNVNFSFNSCIIKIIGDCVAANKHVQAALVNDRKLVLFDDVDIFISIERKLNNTYFPFPLIIRSTDKKNVLEIDQEIRDAVDKTIESENDFFMPEKPHLGKILLDLFYGIPSKIRVFLMETTLKSPFRAKQVIGTIGFATVNITGRLSGWVFPDKNPYSLYIALGSINKKPLVVKNEVQIREVLNMTVIFDHNIIDGTPARNFMNTLVGMIEKGIIEI
jgi:pyruvate/2-oxoglutarate dehydrogenase complex dihydrolipoamide acyltransferase (E2) component